MQENIQLSELVENPFGEKYFPEVSRLNFAKLSSESVFKGLYADLFEPDEFVYIVIGTDSGLLYQYVKNRALNKNLTFIFVEFDEVIEQLGLTNELTDSLNPQIRLANQDFGFGGIGAKYFNQVIRRKITIIKSLAVLDAKPSEPYGRLWEKFEVAFNSFRRSEFNAQSTKVFEEERILNLADNSVPVSKLVGTLCDKDVVVLGGGPTLDDAIDWIKQHQQNLVIFAAARIAKRLANEGIIPDFFVTVDPFDWSFDNSKAVMAFANDSILIHSFHAQHKLVSQWNGLSLYAGSKYGFHCAQNLPNIETPGPTVTNAALHLATSMGAEKVYLSGVDFCFARGLTHESGSDEAKMSDTFGHQGKAKVMDNAGNMTETGDDFYSAMHSMQASIKMYLSRKPHLEFYNFGLHSAKMENVNYVDCHSIVPRAFDKVAFNLENREKIVLELPIRIKIVKDDLKFLKAQQKRFKSIHEYSTEVLKATQKLFNKKTQAQNLKSSEKVKKLRKKVESLIGPDGDMLLNYQAVFFYNTFKPIDENVPMTHEEIQEQLEAFFGGTEKASQHFLAAFEKGIERATLRLNELEGKVLPAELEPLWLKWYELGRAEQWFTWHAGKKLDESNQQALDRTRLAFKNELEKQDHHYKSMVQKRISDVGVLIGRAELAFNQQNPNEIKAIIEHAKSLDAHKAEQKDSFIAMLEGMSAELAQQFDEAMAFYLQVKTPVILRQKALKKMLNIHISLQNYDGTLQTLEQLCAFSLDYMVPYAEILALLGQKSFAIQVLQMYLQTHGENVNALIKYAQMLISVGESESAKQVLEQVLSLDEADKTARHLLENL